MKSSGTDVVPNMAQGILDLIPVFLLGGDSVPQTQARLDIFLKPDEKARLQTELQVLTAKYGRLALANIESAEKSLALVKKEITTHLLGGNDNGRGIPKKIEKTSSGQKGVSGRTSAGVTDDDQQKIVFDALGRHPDEGLSLAQLSFILSTNKEFNPKREKPGVLNLKVLHYLEKLQDQSLVVCKVLDDKTIWSLTKPPGKEGKKVSPSGTGTPKTKGKRKGLDPLKLALLKLVEENDGISGRELHARALDYPVLCGHPSSKISNHLFLLGKAGLIVNKGGQSSSSRRHLTEAGRKALKANGDGEISESHLEKVRRPPPKFELPSSSVITKKKELIAGSEEWEMLILALHRGLEFSPTFEELVQVARSYGKGLGYDVNVSDSFLENQVRAAVLRLKDKGRIVQEGEEIQLVSETSPKVEEDDSDDNDSVLEIFEQEVETEDVPDLDLPPCPSNSETKKITLGSDSTDSDWQSAILEAITKICTADDNQEFSLEQLFDCFREKGGTNNFGISAGLDESVFEDKVNMTLSILEEQNIIVMLGDQTWQLV